MTKQEQIDSIFLNIAEEISQMSKCVSIKVGGVLVRDGRIISTGWNGTPPGFINCCDKFLNLVEGKLLPIDREEHHKWSEKYEIHSEVNCIVHAAKNGIKTEGTIMYCSHQPCHDCLKTLIPAGIKEIVYRHPYDKAGYNDETYAMIEKAKIIFRMEGNKTE